MATYNQTVAEVKKIDAQIARLKARREAKVGMLEKAGKGKHDTDAGSFTVSENNVYSEDVIKALLSPGQVRRCTVPKVDKAVVKRLYPKVYEQAKEERGFKVSVR